MASKEWLESILARAKTALDKPSPYGVDIDITPFLNIGVEDKKVRGSIDLSRVEEVGVNLNANALYLQVDQMYFQYMSRIPGVEVMRLEDFIDQRPDEAREYFWKLIDPASDKYTALAALKGRGGYYIRVKKGAKVEEPIMACLYMSYGGLQAPHNVVVVEDGAEATLYTGCTIAPEVLGLHIDVSEYYVGKNAKLRFVMVHAWNRVAHVRSRTFVSVEEGGEYITYYVNMSRVKTLQTYPKVYLKSGAKTKMVSILLGLGDSHIDTGEETEILGEDAGAELIMRALARDESRIIMRSRIVGKGNSRGHIECGGLMLSDKAYVQTIPELIALDPNVSLTHEAFIGRLAEDEINYLVSKGFTRDEAVSALVRGFASVEIENIPEKVKNYIKSVEKVLAGKAL